VQTRLRTQAAELPAPPAGSATAKSSWLQQEMRSLSKRLQAMEPVNMLALEEYDRTQARRTQSEIVILAAERTELLLD